MKPLGAPASRRHAVEDLNTPARRRRSQGPARRRRSRGMVTPEELRERLIQRIARGGKLCHELEQRLKAEGCPELETIIKLHRVLVLTLCEEAQAEPERLRLVSVLMKPVMAWAQLEEKRKQRELAEQKYHDEMAARQKDKAAEPAKTLSPQTLHKIEHELRLF